MTDFEKVKRTFDCKVYESGTLDDFITEWFQEKLRLIPREYRGQVYFNVYSSPADGRPIIEIGYTRTETDEEFRSRIQRQTSQGDFS